MSAYQAGKPRISSTVTKSNPRPRKYASASERQAAYRARAPEVCFRAEAKTVETLDSIAETLDQPRADLLLSMTKFALANHDWARFGLTHKPLPYGYGLAEQEFIGPRQANPQPIWKRTRPKSLGKPVPLTPKQKAAAKKRAAAAGRPYPNLVDNIAAARLENPTVKKLPVLSLDGEVVGYAGTNAHKQAIALSGGESIRQEFKTVDGVKRLVWVPIKRKENPTMKKPTPAQLAARARFAEMARSGAFKKKAASKRKKNPAGMTWLVHLVGKPESWYATRASKAAATRLANQLNRQAGAIKYEVSEASWSRKANPAKKTVSQKISQLVREGYPQKQAVAVALSEQRAGKVKANPRASNPAKRSGWRVTVLDDNNEPIDQTFDTEEQGALLYAKAKADANMVGEITRVLPKSQKLAYWFDGSGIHPAGSYGERPIYQTRRAQLKANPATGQKGSRTKRNPSSTSRVKYVCIAPLEYSGAKYGIDERTPVTMKFAKTEPAAHLVHACYQLPSRLVQSDDFQNFAYHNKVIYMSLAELKMLLKGYMK